MLEVSNTEKIVMTTPYVIQKNISFFQKVIKLT